MERRFPDRYSRHERFSGIGTAGQQRIRAARVAIAGCGALGSYQAEALTRAGIGFLRLIDRDVVEASNLQRQWLFSESDAEEGAPKAAAAARRLAQINSEVRLEAAVADITAANAEDLLSGVHLILDGTDNFETRFLINDYAVKSATPWIYGAAVASYGITLPVLPGSGPCLRCLYPDPPSGDQPTCETAGVLASITTAVGALQVASALRWISSPEAFRPELITLDVWGGPLRKIAAPPRDPACPCCALRDFPFLRVDRRDPISLCGRNSVQVRGRRGPVDLQSLAGRLQPFGPVRVNEFALRAAIDPYELTVFPDGRAIIKGTTDHGIARSLYARYIGA